MSIPGVTPQIISAGVYGLQEAYAKSFKGVWITAAALSAVATIGQFNQSTLPEQFRLLTFSSCLLLRQA